MNFDRVILSLSLLCAPISFVAAQTTQYWDPSGASAAFTSANWYNGTSLVAPSSVGTIGSTTYNPLVFDDSTVTNRKAAPTAMTTGASIGIASLTFNNNFNGTNSTAISNSSSSNYIYHFSSSWSITNNATSGTVTFSKTSTGNFTFALIGTGTISVANGATVAFGTSVAVTNDSAGLAGGITKTGSGMLSMASTNTYTGGTTVSNGTLSIGGATTLQGATGTALVNGGKLTSTVSSATLGSDLTMSSGTIDPNGSSVGTFTLASGKNLSFTGGTVNLNLLGASTSDGFTGSGGGTFSLSNTTFAIDTTGFSGYGVTYSIFSGFTNGTIGSGITFTGITGYTAAIDSSGNLSFTAVPEPSTYALLGGFAVLGLVAYRRKTRLGR